MMECIYCMKGKNNMSSNETKNLDKHPTVGVGVITYRDGKHLKHCLPPLLKSRLKPRVMVFNSSSNDGTVEEAERLGAETFVIPRKNMNAGTSREKTRKQLGTDIFVAMTPDAYALDEHMIERLVKPIVEGRAAVSYARQIPHDDATPIAKFSRMFNYPEQSQLRGIEDADKYGSYLPFCSDTCAAYSQKALDEIGGFRWILGGEDTVAAAMLLRKGYKIAYVAEAVVKHSHNYSPVKEFIRHFDTGIYRQTWRKTLSFGKGSDGSRGVGYLVGMISYLKKNAPDMLFRGIFQLAMGYAGYLVGKYGCDLIPNKVKMEISHAEFYWKSEEFANGKWKEPAI
jgi:rhamnosyltransferase